VSPEGNSIFSATSVYIGKDLVVNVTVSAIDPISDEKFTYFKDNLFKTFVFNEGFKYIENNSPNNVSKALTTGLVSGLFMSILALVVIMVRRDKKNTKDSQLNNGHNKPKVRSIDNLKNIFYKIKESKLTKIIGIIVFLCLVIYVLYFVTSKPKRITKECIENAVAKAVKNHGDQSDVRYYYWKCEKEHGIRD
jgi:flagellar biosynthesis/type III secretory pathway M-ring protein FliF/YscJ